MEKVGEEIRKSNVSFGEGEVKVKTPSIV